jgi:tetratricopeptide (TPR) repeat protein
MTSTDPLVGRRQELDLLRQRLAEARAGSGQLVLVSGPGGIGKTRLVEELVAAAKDVPATPVGWGAAVTDAGMPALWPWVRALRDLPGPNAAMSSLVAGTAQASGSAQDAAAATFAADTAVLDALADAAKSGSGLLIVLDDLQWADAATLRLLNRLTTELRRLPILVVGTQRDPVAVHRAAEVVHLGPLSPSESAAVLSAAVDNADTAAVLRAAKLSGGSPLYLRTLARVARDQLRGGSALDVAIGASPELRHLVAAAFEAAGEPAANAVEALSVLGSETDPELIAGLLELASPSAAIELLLPAVPAGLVEITSGSVRFAHGLVKEAAYASLPPQRRAELHRRAAELLEPAAVARDDRAAAVARHWLLAGEPSRATTWAVHAASAARAAGAYEEAAEYFRLAVDAGGVADQAELLLDLARVQYLAGQIQESLDSCVHAAAEGERTGRATLVGRAAIIVQSIGHLAVNHTLDDLCRRALHLLGDGAELALVARIEAQLSCVLHELGAVDEAADWSLRALDKAIASGDPNAELDAIRARAAATWLPEHGPELAELGGRAIELAGTVGRPLARLWAHVWRSDIAVRGADMPAAAREIAGIESLAQRTGLPMVRWHLFRRQAAVAALTGRFDNARRLAAQAVEIAQDWQDDSVRFTHLAHTVLLGMLRGDAAEVPPEWTEHVDIAPTCHRSASRSSPTRCGSPAVATRPLPCTNRSCARF